MLVFKNQVAGYLSANFTEDEPAWVISTPYSYGDEVREGHDIYKSRLSGTNTNTGNQPSLSPLEWKRVRPTNYFAQLDGYKLTQTVVANQIVIEIALNYFDAITLLELDAYSVRIEITDLNTNIKEYDQTFSLEDRSVVTDLFSYFYAPYSFRDSFYLRIPLYGNGKAKITIDKTGSFAKCGLLSAGQTRYIGSLQWSPSFSLASYGRSVTDEFGYDDFVHYNSTYNDSYILNIQSGSLRPLQRLMKQYDFQPLIFIGHEKDNSKFENLVEYGRWQNVDIALDGPVISKISIKKKGII